MVDTGEGAAQTQPENRAAAVSLGAAITAVMVAGGSLWMSAASFYMPLTFG